MRKISRTEAAGAVVGRPVRKTSNPEYSGSSEVSRERSNTLPSNTTRIKRGGGGGGGLLAVARRETNNSDDSIAGDKHSPPNTGSLSSTTTVAGGSDFRSRSNTLPSGAAQYPRQRQQYIAGQQSSDHSSNDSLHSSKNGSSKDLSKVGKARQTTTGGGSGGGKKQRTTVSSRRQPNDRSPLSAGDILDNYIQKVSTVHKPDQLPSGSDIFEELRSELYLSSETQGFKVKVELENDNKENASSKRTSKQMTFLHSTFSDDMAKSCSTPSSPALTRRVHFKGVP